MVPAAKQWQELYGVVQPSPWVGGRWLRAELEGHGVVVLGVRQLTVPGAANPGLPGSWGLLEQVAWYLHFRLLMETAAGLWWSLPAPVGASSR